MIMLGQRLQNQVSMANVLACWSTLSLCALQMVSPDVSTNLNGA